MNVPNLVIETCRLTKVYPRIRARIEAQIQGKISMDLSFCQAEKEFSLDEFIEKAEDLFPEGYDAAANELFRPRS